VRRTTTIAALFSAAALALSACGSDDNGDDAEAATDAGGNATDCVNQLDSDLTLTAGESGVDVNGSFGDKPELEIPDADPSEELTFEVLSEGDGDEVRPCDYVTVDYLGQSWVAGDDSDENVFDNSFDRGEPFRLTLGIGQVIAGWDAGLTGQKVGSRVLLSIPPEHAYGTDESAHDLGGDTLLFVVDIVDRIPADAAISGDAASDLPEGLPVVTGDGASAEPEVDVSDAEGTEESDATVLIAGDGADLEDYLVAKFLQVNLETGETLSTWNDVAWPIVFQASDVPGLAEALEGHKVGSRALVRIGTDDNPETGESLAIVLDIVGTHAAPDTSE
jgi:FKBP-type peptidyl-prolyl cis-trans isomerase 2